MEKQKVILDTDMGHDDAQALMMALAAPNIELIAVTTVFGNTWLEQAADNALRCLRACDRTDVPVYMGSAVSLLRKESISDEWHGKDGFGDQPDENSVDHDKIAVQEEPAVLALIRLVRQYPGEISLIAIGPLTNIALALSVDPTFGKNLKDCYVMGGNIYGKGNLTPSAEFNFISDPEAAYIVLHGLQRPITIATLEPCEETSFKWDLYDKLLSRRNKKSEFFKKINEKPVSIERKESDFYHMYDQVAMAAAIDNEVISKSESLYATVELAGNFARGQMVVDWANMLKKPHNINVIKALNMEKYIKIVFDSVK